MIRCLFLLLLLPSVSLAQGAAVASAHPLATDAGLRILEKGGNAFDAAIAVSAVLAVVEPYSSGLGGGGFWLLHEANSSRTVMVDGRERAPLAAHRDMYLNNQGEVIADRSVDGPLAAGIPGEPAALAHLAKHYARLPLGETLAPAIQLAREGFSADRIYRDMARFRLEVLRASPASAAAFLDNGQVPTQGSVIRQTDLADTLQALAERGHDGFYRGEVAQELVAGVRDAGGIWTLEDLAHYQVVERPPIQGRFRGMTIHAASPPSSGGVVLMEILNQLQDIPLETLPPAKRVHYLVEAMRRAYADRAVFLGDPDFVDMPLQRLLSDGYARALRASIDPQRATPSAELPKYRSGAGLHTTHFSILDSEGNRVAATLSINYPFGSGFTPPGTGVLLNDEMDDFSARPGTPNVYGLVGGEANAIAPGKRMLSSMTPTFVESDDQIAILGTPGGSRIITMVLLAILDMAEGNSPESWVSLPRFHHQYLPDQIQFEPDALAAKTQAKLQAMGHTLKPLQKTYGNMQTVRLDKRTGVVDAASDPRGIGTARAVEGGGLNTPRLPPLPRANTQPGLTAPP
ncbi:MAG: gamma-glutamyltransferase [Chromatiales bacterium]|nr:gamma-glutamyltransferase [Chromatiales bacterium]